MREVRAFVMSLLREADNAHKSAYRDGYMAALTEVVEWIESEMWEQGEDYDEGIA